MTTTTAEPTTAPTAPDEGVIQALPPVAPEEPRQPTHGEVGRRLAGYLRPFRWQLGLGLLCGALVGATEAGILGQLKHFIDRLGQVPAGAAREAATRGLGVICLTVVLLYAVSGLLKYGQNVLLARVAQYVGLNIRRDIYAHLQGMSLAYFHRRRTGALMSVLTADVPKLQNAAMMVKDVVATPIQALIFLGTLIYLSPMLTGFIVLVVPFMAAVIQRLTRRLRNISNETQTRLADAAAVMEETLAAPRVVRAFTAESHEIKRFEEKNRLAIVSQLKAVSRSARLGPVVDLIGAAGIAAALYVGGRQVLAGDMSAGDLVMYIGVVSKLANCVNAMGGLKGGYEEMMGAADRIFADVLDVTPDIADAPGAAPMPRIAGRVEFRDVSFSYDGVTPTLQNIALTVEPGQVVALVGPTGAGKSTLADLIPRFYDPQAGAVLIDGRDVRTVTVESLRRQIGIVPQETLLFSGTIRENIAYGRRDATLAEVMAAARAANADSFIESMPDGYDSLVGERGQTLSGGQRQRIAIARALLADPRILILDEATSALDASTEALVQEALETLMQGRTTFVIAHRLSTIMNADRIVVLQRGGRIAEVGTHRELIERGGVYAALYETQQRAADLTLPEL
jgi:subfamily B ATP-binding cassette protein MsbA